MIRLVNLMKCLVVIELQFIVPPEDWVGKLCTIDSVTIKVLGIKLDDSLQNITHFVDITSDKMRIEDLSKELQASCGVLESDVASLGTNRMVGVVTSNDCKVGIVIMNYGFRKNG